MRPHAALLLLLLAIPACSLLNGGGDDWTERTLETSPPRRDLLAYCERALAQAGYPAPMIDEAASEAQSGWRAELHPFGGVGRRYRGTLRLEPAEAGGVTVRARVEAQSNAEKSKPLDPAAADWNEEPADEARARILLQHLWSLLETSGALAGTRR